MKKIRWWMASLMIPGMVLANQVQDIRVSAIIEYPTTVQVGIHNRSTGEDFLVRLGETVNGVTLRSADFDRELISLSVSGQIQWYNLEGDAVLREANADRLEEEEALLRALPGSMGESIDAILRTNAQARLRLFEDPFLIASTNPPVVGLGPGIEEQLRASGLPVTNPVGSVTGRGETIERLMAGREAPEVIPIETPENAVTDAATPAEDPLEAHYGPGIAELMRRQTNGLGQAEPVLTAPMTGDESIPAGP